MTAAGDDRAPAADRLPFQYSLVRVVPRVQRGEFVNVGVMLHCPGRDWLAVRIELDADRVVALDPDADLVAIRVALDAVQATVDGHGGGPQVDADPGSRFRWLAAPRSAVIQFGPTHTGMTADPADELEVLYTQLVA